MVFKTQIDYVSELRIANVSPGEPDKDQTMPGPQRRYMICQRKKRWQGLARIGKAWEGFEKPHRIRNHIGTISEPHDSWQPLAAEFVRLIAVAPAIVRALSADHFDHVSDSFWSFAALSPQNQDNPQ